MAKEIDKIIQSKTSPKSNNVLWDDGENLKINRNGKWESTGSGLNIDPELIDYFINPVVLKNGDKVPEALYDKENDTLKGAKEGRIYPYIKYYGQFSKAESIYGYLNVLYVSKNRFEVTNYMGTYEGFRIINGIIYRSSFDDMLSL